MTKFLPLIRVSPRIRVQKKSFLNEIRRYTMFTKHVRHWVVILLCTLSITLAACGETAEPTALSPTAATEPTAIPPTETPISPTSEPETEAVEEVTETEIITETEAITETVEEAAPVSVVGELTFPSLGNEHIPFGSRSPIEYNTVPPSSGPHYSNIIQWDIYDKPIPYELLVHNLEDGGVTIYYQCEEPCPELVQQLSEAITPYLDYNWHVVVSPNEPDGEGQFWHVDMGAKEAIYP